MANELGRVDETSRASVSPGELVHAATQIDIAIELKGSVAVLEGVVLRAYDRVRIADLILSLDFVSRVENKLRPAA